MCSKRICHDSCSCQAWISSDSRQFAKVEKGADSRGYKSIIRDASVVEKNKGAKIIMILKGNGVDHAILTVPLHEDYQRTRRL